MKTFDLTRYLFGRPSVYMFYDVASLDDLFDLAANDNGTFRGVFWK